MKKQPPPPARDLPGLAIRRVALDALHLVLGKGRMLDEAMATLPPQTDGRDVALVRASVTATLRHLGQIDALLAAWMDRPLPPEARPVRDLLRLSMAQLLVMGMAAHAVIHTSAELAKGLNRGRYAGLVNALLRRAQREGAQAFAAFPATVNLPDWLRDRWTQTYGAAAVVDIAAAHLEEPPLDLSLKPGASIFVEGAQTLLPDTVRLPVGVGRVEALPGFEDGSWWVQDVAASLPARALLAALAAEGRTTPAVADICAAPGGKTAQLAAGGARVWAVDRSAPRLKRLEENLARLHLFAEVVCADATEWTPPAPVEAVLLDAPCSATGTIRRHPELPHQRAQADIDRLAALQARLLDHAAGLLAPSGLLMYAVCSLEPEEGEAQAAAFVDRHPDMAPVPLGPLLPEALPSACLTEQGTLRSLPHHLAGGMDGFFAALFCKRA